MEIQPKQISIVKDKIKIKTKRPGMIVFAQSWCPYCEENKPVYLQVAQMMSNQPLNFFYIEGDANKENEKLFKRLSAKKLTKGYPTILFFNESGDIISEFNSPRTINGYLTEICQKLKICKQV